MWRPWTGNSDMGVHSLPNRKFDAGLDQNVGGTEPPDNDDMEPRVAKLEELAQDARERLTRIEATIDHVKHETSQLKWWMAGSAVAIIVTVIAAVLGTGVAIQQMTVSTFQAAAQQATTPAAQPAPIIFNFPPGTPAPAAPK